MSKVLEKKTPGQNSIWDVLRKATTKNSEWPDKVNINGWDYYPYLYLLKDIILYLYSLLNGLLRMNFWM